jgi:DUF1365 family protein
VQDATEGLSTSEKEKVETLVAVSGAAVDEAVVRLALEDRRLSSPILGRTITPLSFIFREFSLRKQG